MGARSLTGSNGVAGFSSLAIVMLPLIITPIVWSSVALTTASAAMLPPAPGLLSTITGWPSALDSGSAIVRATRSGVEPPGKPTRMRSGRVGQAAVAASGLAPVCASTGAEAAARAADRAVRREMENVMEAVLVRPCRRTARAQC